MNFNSKQHNEQRLNYSSFNTLESRIIVLSPGFRVTGPENRALEKSALDNKVGFFNF